MRTTSDPVTPRVRVGWLVAVVGVGLALLVAVMSLVLRNHLASPMTWALAEEAGQVVVVGSRDPAGATVLPHVLMLGALAVAVLLVTFMVARASAQRMLSATARQALDQAERRLQAEWEYSWDLAHVVRSSVAGLREDLERAVAGGEPGLTGSLDRARKLERAASAIVLLNQAGQPGFLSPRPTAMDEVVRDAVVRWADHLDVTSPQRVVLGTLAAVVMPVDEARLGRGLDEVIANAVEACRDGGLVEVSSAVVGTDLDIEVGDTGIGTPDGEHDLVLERFARAGSAHRAPLDPAAGSGLGLPLARAVVEAHGGSIALRPRMPGGTQLLVRLPVA